MSRWDERRGDGARFAGSRFAVPRFGPGGATGGASFDLDAAALFAAMSPAPDAARQQLLNTYITGLKSAGIWPLLDILYVLAQHSAQAARLNFKDPATFTLANVGAGPTFETDRDATGNGSSTALSTQWTPSSDAVQFTQDNASMWVWARDNIAENAADCGAAVTHSSFIRTRSAGDAISMTLNGATTSTSVIASSIGMTGISRADGTTQRIWKNGVQQGTGFAGASTGLPAGAVRICGRATDLFSTKGIAMFAAGASLGGRELAFYNLTHAFLQGVGAA